MIFDAFFKALSQLGDTRFRGVLLRALGLTIGLLAVFYFGFVWVLGFFLPETFTLPWIGEVSFLSNALSWVAIGGMLVLSVFLMMPVASAFTGFFLEDIADAVEEKYYPQLPKVTPVPLRETINDSVRFLGLMVIVNLLALVIYVMSTALAPVVFWLVNGFLLGREYFQLVAMRRLGREGANKLRARHRWVIWLAGVLMAVPLTFPLINLLVPIVGVATFTHLFHALKAEDS